MTKSTFQYPPDQDGVLSSETRNGTVHADGNRASFKRLRDILLSPEWSRLHQLEERLDDQGRRAGELAKVLPAALSRSDQDELGRALSTTIGVGITSSVKSNIHLYANALFPVMGPAIRRAITMAIKNMVQSIGQVIDQSFSLRGLKWRLIALRTGVPFHEVVLRNSFVYRVEQVFLINRADGLLLQHVHQPDTETTSSDAVSSMLTAITDFVGDSFIRTELPVSSQQLESMQVGDYTVWLIPGPQAMLACVIRGLPPEALHAQLMSVIERVHKYYGHLIEAFNGDNSTLEPVHGLLLDCLRGRRVDSERKLGPALSTPNLVALTMLALLTGLWVYTSIAEKRQFAAFVGRLEATPGIVVISAELDNDRPRIRALRDELAPPVATIAEGFGYDSSKLNLSIEPYYAHGASIALRRAQQRLSPPDSVEMSLTSNVLKISGVATRGWIEAAERTAGILPGIDSVDATELVDTTSARLHAIRNLLAPPDTVAIELDGNRLGFSGTAPADWIAGAIAQRAALTVQVQDELRYDMTGLSISAEDIEMRNKRLSTVSLLFEENAELIDGQDRVLQALSDELMLLNSTAASVGQTLSVELIGNTDQTGTRQLNHRLALDRAGAIKQIFQHFGVPADSMQLRIGMIEARPGAAKDPAKRRVTVRVQVQ